MVRKSVHWGADINHRNKEDETALILATKNGKVDVVSYLLSQLIPSSGDSKSAAMPITPEDMGMLLCYAAGYSDDSVSMQLLTAFSANRFDIRSRHPFNGMNALHACCEVGNESVYKHLLKVFGTESADFLESMDDGGQTPLHKACQTSKAITENLLELLCQGKTEK